MHVMAVVSVPRPLQDRLGDDASASLVEMLRQLEDEQEERREVQKEHLFQLLEERFLRHVAESDHRTRKELGNEISDVRKELGNEISDVRKELGNEISDVRKELGNEISDVRKELGKEISEVRKEDLRGAQGDLPRYARRSPRYARRLPPRRGGYLR